MAELIRVGMSEIAVSRSPDVLVAIGLGSCVGVCFYDPVLKYGVWPMSCCLTAHRFSGREQK